LKEAGNSFGDSSREADVDVLRAIWVSSVPKTKDQSKTPVAGIIVPAPVCFFGENFDFLTEVPFYTDDNLCYKSIGLLWLCQFFVFNLQATFIEH
jgi:hypothetical protein